MNKFNYVFFTSFLVTIIAINGIPPITELREEIAKSKKITTVEFVDFVFVDIFGNQKSVTLPSQKASAVLSQGIFFDGSSISGYQTLNESDLRAQPDLSALYMLPWGTDETKSLVIMCDICESDGIPHKNSCRAILYKTLKHAQALGFHPYCGVEIEFSLLRKDNSGAIFPVDSYGYCDSGTNPLFKSFQNGLLAALEVAGIEIEKLHHEVAPGQYEIVLKYNDPIKTADSLILARYIIQAAAQSQGLIANFMPKLFPKQNGNGMHVHMSLFDTETGKNAFYANEGISKLSSVAHHFIAGNLNRLQEAELLLNSSVNSFKRLVRGYEAPIYLCWGKRNRSAALRIPDVSDEYLVVSHGAAMRVEFRIPDASCNPYLAFAALIEAGLQGIELCEKAPLPIEHNLYHVDQETLDALQVKVISSCLGECIELYKHSEFVKNLLGASLFAKILEIKEQEWLAYSKQEKHDLYEITTWEKRYHGL